MENTTKSKTKIRLKSNGVTIPVSHQLTVNSYHSSVFFSENTSTNIISLRNLRLQYLFAYRNNYIMFIFHRESVVKPNMQFIMYEIGLHYFDSMDQEFTFFKTVSENKEGFTEI